MQGGDDVRVVHKELSYQIIEILFEVFNNLGYGYQEKYYQKAIEASFRKAGINFIAQCPYKIKYKGEIIGKYFIDFIVEDKIVLEIKKGNYFAKRNFEQVEAYLKITGFELAILANFASTEVEYKRVLNLKNSEL